MKTLDEVNKENQKKYKKDLQVTTNGIECPICGKELWDGDPRMIIATYPPKTKVFCKGCGFADYKVL